MSRLLAGLWVLALLLAGARSAEAASQHFAPEKIKRTPTGCSITFCVKPSGHHVMRVVIGDRAGNAMNNTDYTGRVTRAPYALKVFPAQRFSGQTTHTIEVEYANGIRSGGTYDLVTAWNSSEPQQEGQAAEHVWGMGRSSAQGIAITLP